MSWRRPPVVATWVLQHLGDRYRREELVGDLVEEYQLGRSYGWYWWQVICALCAAGRNRVWRDRSGFRALMIWWGGLLVLGISFRQPFALIFALDPFFVRLFVRARRRRAPTSRTDT